MKKVQIIFLSILLSCILVGFTGCSKTDNSKDVSRYTSNEDANNTTEDYISPTDSIESKPSQAETTAITSESSEPPTSQEINPRVLYKDKTKLVNQYTRYASGYSEGQSYAKIRFGPSKADYDVVSSVDNGTMVTVQSSSVNGWTMIYCPSVNAEGWMRTDFLYANQSDCFEKTTAYYEPEEYGVCGFVNIDDEYKYTDPNLRMHSGPSKDYDLITSVPNHSSVKILTSKVQSDTWIYINYNGYRGWVLKKYIFVDEVGDKPVLYLYPTEPTDVDVTVDLKNVIFTCTYPAYNNGWSVVANPDGTLINKADGNEYSYLYWELGGKQNYDFSKGFVVKGEDTVEFLQTTLAKIGLTPKEYNEFIVYWLPKMQNNPYNLISFQGAEYTDNVKLHITPKPDSVLRVFMAYKPLDHFIEISPQQFNTFNRTGFTVVEWGGAEVK